jgi:hypothetical protein
MDFDLMRDQLNRDGFVIIRDFLTDQEAQHYVSQLEALSTITRSDLESRSTGRGFSGSGSATSWNLPDGVSKTPAFWPLILDERLVSTVKELLGLEIRFLQHTDLHVGFSAISWHRDSVSRTFGVGPDWDEANEPYQLVRVGVYLQSYEESNFRLGFIKGSHRPATEVTLGRKFTEAKINWMGALSYLSPKVQMWAANAEWVATEPGDCIIFDPRTIHSGSYITGPKYSMFVAYGIENKHFYNHYNYYRHVRTELNYQELTPELVGKLKTAGLYPENIPVYDQIEGAWTPTPVLKNVLNKRFAPK